MKTQKKAFFLFYFGFLYGLICFGFLSFALEPQGPLALSMSGSGRAAVQRGAEYHLLNPAALIHSYSFSGSAYYIFEQKTEKPYWGVSLLENRTLPVSYTHLTLPTIYSV